MEWGGYIPAGLLGGLMLCSPSIADADYLFTNLISRGTVTQDSTSLGAFTILNNFYSFQGLSNNNDYTSYGFGLSSAFNPALATSTTLSYPSGTGALAQSPFELKLYLPTGTGSAPVLFDAKGDLGLNLTTTVASGSVRFSLSSTSTDPLGEGVDQVTVNGVITSGSDGPDSVSYSLVFRNATYLIVVRSSGYAAESVPSDGTGYVLSQGDTIGTGPTTFRNGFADGTTPSTMTIANPNGSTDNKVIFLGDSLYTGGTTIGANATLQLGDGGTAGSIVGNIANAGLLIFDRSDTVIFSGTVSGSGSLSQIGGGTLILGGLNTYTGGTTINPGSTLIVAPGGQIGPGAISNAGNLVLTTPQSITGNYTQTGTGALTLTLGSTDGGRLVTSGSADLSSGTVMVNLTNGYVPFGTYTLVSAAKTGTLYNPAQVQVNLNGADVVYNVFDVDPPATESLVLAAQPIPTAYADTLMVQRRDFLSLNDSVAARLEATRGAPSDPAGHRADAGGWTVWAAAHGDFSHTSGVGSRPGFDSSGGGGVLGLDRRIADATRVGLAMAVADEGIGGGSGASYQGQSGQLRLYATSHFGRMFIDGMIGGVVSSGTMTRQTGSGVSAHGNVDGRGVGASLRAGARYTLGGWGLEPSVTLGGMSFAQDSVGEKDAGLLNLAVSRGNLSSLYTLVGIEADHSFALGGDYTLVTAARLGWLHELAATDTHLTATLGGPVVGFASAPIGRDAAQAALQADLRTSERFSFYARYETYLASRASSESVEGGLRYRW